MQKRKFSTYNDGVIRVYREKPKQTDFGAKRNARSIDDMELVARLDYEEASRREEDIEFAKQSGFSLTLKVKTRAVNGVNNLCKAVINEYLYDVRHTDKDRTDMWLYLEGVRKLAT